MRVRPRQTPRPEVMTGIVGLFTAEHAEGAEISRFYLCRLRPLRLEPLGAGLSGRGSNRGASQVVEAGHTSLTA